MFYIDKVEQGPDGVNRYKSLLKTDDYKKMKRFMEGYKEKGKVIVMNDITFDVDCVKVNS